MLMDFVAPTPIPPIQPSYKDRRTGLIVFGIFAILVGAFCALLVPLAFFGQMMAARQLGTTFDASAAVVSAVVYGLLAAGLIWLGVGSVLARRWARALLLCLGWIGLVIGLISLPAVFGVMNSIGDILRAQDPSVSPGKVSTVRSVLLAIAFIIYIAIPGAAVLFYRSAHVRHTCEVRDPVRRWTDRCPLPVLALTLINAFAIPILLLTLPFYGRVFPLAGFVVQGRPARLLWVVVIVFMAYVARGLYRLDLRAWWIYTAGTLVLWTSSLVTLLWIGPMEFYRQMGLPQSQLDLMANSPLIRPASILWISLPSVAIFLGYLRYVRRYFAPAKDRPAAA